MRGSIDDVIQGLQDYKKQLTVKADALLKALADAGAGAAQISFAGTGYMGNDDVDVSVVQRGPLSYAIEANGEAVLFLEFGAGVTMGGGHENPMGYGPGTYPGKGHWDDPNGWWLPRSAGGGHTYGNAPSMAMYHTGKSLHAVVAQAAREVFGS